MQRKAVTLSFKMHTTWIMHRIWDTTDENQNKYKECDVFAASLLKNGDVWEYSQYK